MYKMIIGLINLCVYYHLIINILFHLNILLFLNKFLSLF